MVSPKDIIAGREITAINEPRWQRARERLEAIRPLLEPDTLNRAKVAERARETGISVASLYRWIKAWHQGENLSSLLPRLSGPAPDNAHHLPSAVDGIIASVLTASARPSLPRQSVGRVVHRIAIECKRSGLPAPHPVTIWRRRRKLEQSTKVAPIQGGFPKLPRPLAVVQIDHTKLDIMVVDEFERRPIGRPWLTIAIDVFSRAIAGIFLSLDAPGFHSVGMCLSHAILPKEAWLAKLNIEDDWPVSGLMDVVHADNGREFHSKSLERAAQEWDIELQWRPVKRPWYGGHIERLIGTVTSELHNVSGTTLSNPVKRRGYDSEKNAVMTLTELERWLAIWITGVYHSRVHRELGVSPIVKYKTGIREEGLQPRVVSDKAKLTIDFLPSYERTIGRSGITVDGIAYWSDVLRPWVQHGSGDNNKRFLVRRDPRDISAVWFWDTETACYLRIPYRDLSHPATSIWDYREAYRRARDERHGVPNEGDVFQAHERLQREEAEATRKTKGARRKLARQHEHGRAAHQTETAGKAGSEWFSEDLLIKGFEEIEEL